MLNRKFVLMLIMTVVLGATGCGWIGGFGTAGETGASTTTAITWSDATTCTVSFYAMDTYMSMTAYEVASSEALEGVAAMIMDLEAELSATNESSAVARLNAGEVVQLEADSATVALLNRAREVYTLTEGSLDISIYPVVKLWGFTTGEYQVPAEAELIALLETVGFDKIDLGASASSLQLPSDMQLDFGALAKGYAGDVARESLAEAGIDSAILSLGGNIVTIGSKVDGSSWRVAITDPASTDDYAAVVEVADVSVVTSGVYERNFTDEATGVTYCHIIDPSTGYPVDNGLLSVTVICADGTLADGLSTALMVMGQEAALDFWRTHQDLDFQLMLINDSGQVLITQGLEGSMTLMSQDYELVVIE